MKKTLFVVGLIWIVLTGSSFTWNYLNSKTEQKAIALNTAKGFFNQIIISRLWNSNHGGVYVPVTENTQPNPYLHVPLREIKVNENLTLTKINPAFMTRQISEISTREKGIIFHITSLKPIRPENRPTHREEFALKSFDKGLDDFGEIINNATGKTFFYMAPLKVERTCLECHVKQGYKVGGIIGGISVTLPFVAKIPMTALITGHLLIGVTGIFGIFFFGSRLNTAYESIKRQAVFDSLTGIPNRRSFSDRILSESQRSRRGSYPLSVVMGDIDNFKEFNDNYGHQNGDECLRQVARCIEKTLKRPGDFCARYGGEEFIIILPNTNKEGAKIVADKIRMEIKNLNIQHEKSSTDKVVSISLGVATSDFTVSTSHEDLINQADKGLYLAKEKGRNRVEVFNET